MKFGLIHLATSKAPRAAQSPEAKKGVKDVKPFPRSGHECAQAAPVVDRYNGLMAGLQAAQYGTYSQGHLLGRRRYNVYRDPQGDKVVELRGKPLVKGIKLYRSQKYVLTPDGDISIDSAKSKTKLVGVGGYGGFIGGDVTFRYSTQVLFQRDGKSLEEIVHRAGIVAQAEAGAERAGFYYTGQQLYKGEETTVVKPDGSVEESVDGKTAIYPPKGSQFNHEI